MFGLGLKIWSPFECCKPKISEPVWLPVGKGKVNSVFGVHFVCCSLYGLGLMFDGLSEAVKNFLWDLMIPPLVSSEASCIFSCVFHVFFLLLGFSMAASCSDLPCLLMSWLLMDLNWWACCFGLRINIKIWLPKDCWMLKATEVAETRMHDGFCMKVSMILHHFFLCFTGLNVKVVCCVV